MDDVDSIPFRDDSYLDLPIDVQIRRAKEWLEENTNHPKARFVQRQVHVHQRAATVESLTLRTFIESWDGLVDRTASEPYWPETHDSAEVVDVPLGNLSDLNKLFTDEFLNTLILRHPNKTNCDSEDEAVSCVVAIVEAIIMALKFERVIKVVIGRQLAGVECDVLLLYEPSRLPFAAIEVKKPGSERAHFEQTYQGLEQQNKVAGQILDEMTAIKLFGFSKVFGMIATANHWRLVSTGPFNSQDDDLVSFHEIFTKHMISLITGEREIVGNSEDICDEQVSVSPEKNFSTVAVKEIKRQIFGSQIIQIETESGGLQILQLVTTFVLKACSSLYDFLHANGINVNPYLVGPTEFLRERPLACRILSTKGEKKFAFGVWSCKEEVNLQSYSFINQTETIYVIRLVGSGDYGSCCLGVSESGKTCCVVKFYHDQSNSKVLAKAEEENWGRIYIDEKQKRDSGDQGALPQPPMPHVRTICDRSFLVMPYLRPVMKSERLNFLQTGKIKEALERFSSTGCTHNDVKWRHVGLWKEEIFLIDLGAIKQNQTEEEVKKWLTKSLKYLSDRAGEIPELSSGVSALDITSPPSDETMSPPAAVEKMSSPTTTDMVLWPTSPGEITSPTAGKRKLNLEFFDSRDEEETQNQMGI